MARQLGLKVHRYLTANEFASDLNTLRVFRGSYIGNTLLESLERDGLIKPKLRLHWPDPIARRIWLDRHDNVQSLHEPVEPDGSRWTAAMCLYNNLQGTEYSHEVTQHPFDAPKPEVCEFIQDQEDLTFIPHCDRKVSVANDLYPVLYDNSNVTDFYSGWQVLAAAEVADMGVHIRTNMVDPEIARAVRSAIRDKRIVDGYVHECFEPIYAARGFLKHEATLDSIVWYIEHSNSALTRIRRHQGGGRVWLTDDQTGNYHDERAEAAHSGLQRYGVDRAAMISVCQFLAGRWCDWNSEGRPLIAEAYKIYLASAVQIIRMTSDMTFESIRAAVGHQGTSVGCTLDAIWPDWADEQKDRVVRTLQDMIIKDGPGALSLDEIVAFSGFVKDQYQDAIFLRLESFERHAFEETDAPIAGMASDLQGMAVAVEHAVRAMGGTKAQLFQMFRQLWRGSPVSTRLRQNKKLAEQASQPWPTLKTKIDSLRSTGPAEAVAADLIMAHRLRAAVHKQLPEEDQFEVEKLVVILLRAAALTHAHVNRQDT